MLYKARQIETQETLEELKKLIEEINSAKSDEERLKMSIETFSILWMFKKEGIKDPNEMLQHWRKY